MGVRAVHNLCTKLLSNTNYQVNVSASYQMLGEADEDLRKYLYLEVVGIHLPKNMFGFKNENWKPYTMYDGTIIRLPGDFNYSIEGGGFVSITVHSIQSNVPVDNMIPIFKSLNGARGIKQNL